MPLASVTNPNVCPGCVQLLDDDSPLMMALHTSAPDELAASVRREETEPRAQTSRPSHHALN